MASSLWAPALCNSFFRGPGGLEEEVEGVLEVDTEPLGVLGRGDADEELPVSEMSI